MKVAVLTLRKKDGREKRAVFENEAGATRFLSEQGFTDCSDFWTHPNGIIAAIEVTERTADMPDVLLP
jgi:hypothetical protein